MLVRSAGSISLALIFAVAAPSWSEEEQDEGGKPEEKAAEKPAGKEAKKKAVKKEAAPPDAEPQLKVDKAKVTFTKGRELFDMEKYPEALKEMQKLKGGYGKTKDDEALIERWILACKGGVVLDGYKRDIDRGNIRANIFRMMDQAETYRQTPISQKFSAYIDEVLPRACLVLDSFDQVTNRYKKEFGKEFVGDPDIVYRGANCLLWTSTRDGKAAQLPFTHNFVKNWNEYYSIVFWMRVEKPVEIRLIAMGAGKSKGGDDPNAYEYTFTPQPRAGWQRIEVRIEEFKKHGSASWGNIEKFVFQIDKGTSFKFYLDDVLLVRKDAGEQEKDSKDKDTKDKKKKNAGGATAGKVKQTERKSQ
jgi:hypothetical protein